MYINNIKKITLFLGICFLGTMPIHGAGTRPLTTSRAEALYIQGLKQKKAGNLPEAIKALKRYVATDSQDHLKKIHAYSLLAPLSLEQGIKTNKDDLVSVVTYYKNARESYRQLTPEQQENVPIEKLKIFIEDVFYDCAKELYITATNNEESTVNRADAKKGVQLFLEQFIALQSSDHYKNLIALETLALMSKEAQNLTQAAAYYNQALESYRRLTSAEKAVYVYKFHEIETALKYLRLKLFFKKPLIKIVSWATLLGTIGAVSWYALSWIKNKRTV